MLTGRDEEFGVIAGSLAGLGYRGVVIAGKAGVGKSRLAREAALTAAAAGWTVRNVAATATGRSIPLGAFAPWSDTSGGAPPALAHKVIDALTAGTDPGRLMMFVDDAHLLDERSALVVHQLAVQHAATIIATIRAGEPVPDAVTALWKDGLLRRLDLDPLARGHTDALLQAVLGAPADTDCAERLWRLTQGNVLFLRQLVDHERAAGRLVARDGQIRWTGSPGVSASLIEIVEQQIGAVADAVRDVVDLVAVAEPVQRDSLAALTDPLAVAVAEQRELIRTAGDEVFVGHPMYAEIRLHQCGPLRLRRLRGLLATAMKDDVSAATSVRRALLWLESDLPPDPQVLTSAATAASSLLDFGLAERFSRAAAEAGVGVGARVHLAYNLFMQGKGGAAADAIDSIAAGEVSPEAFINDVILRAANLLWALRSPQGSWRVIDDALNEATGTRVRQLLAFRANQLALAGRPHEVITVMADVDYGTLDAFGATIGLCSETLAYGEIGQPDAAVARAADCHRVVDTSEQAGFLGHPLAEYHAFALTAAGRIDEALEVAAQHRRRHNEGPDTARTLADSIMGMNALAAGDLDGALRWLPDTRADTDADLLLANSFHRFQLLRSQALARSGLIDAAADALHAAQAHRHPSYVYVESTALIAQSWLAAARQHLDDARELAGKAAEFAREHGQSAREVMCLQTATQFGDTTVAQRLTELAAVVQGPRAPAAARYGDALQRDDAAELEAVSLDFEAMGDRLTAADAAGQAAASHRAAGRTGSAMTASDRADRLARECGNATSPAIAAARFTLPFTQREREIALLVAQGMSNRDIAEKVSLSVRTIEGHIYRASCKAGTAKRTDLARLVNSFAPRAFSRHPG